MIQTYVVNALDAFPLVVLKAAQPPYALHRHDFVELVIITAGRGLHYNAREAYAVMTGDCFVVSGAHGYRDTENLELVNILFYPSRLGLPLDQARTMAGYHAFFALEPQYRRQHRFRSCLRLAPERLSDVIARVDRLAEELRACRPGHTFIAIGQLMELIGLLSRAYAGTTAVEAQPLLNLGDVLSHLERHYMTPITLDDLARRAHLSRRQLNRVFLRVTGCTPMDYLIRLRIHRACDLLRSGTVSITEAALRVGFNDSNYFSRQFRAIMNGSPRAYARLQPKP